MPYLFIFMSFFMILQARVQRSDFLDNCDWCKKQARYTQPLDIGEWMVKCQKKPKDLWFTMKHLGRVYGTYQKSISRSWIYSKKLGWIYNAPAYKGYFYSNKLGWVYIKDDMIYLFTERRWDYLININS